MLGRRTKSESSPSESAQDQENTATDRDPAQQPKGHATPKRKESQTQRKQALRVTGDPKEAKKAMRQREREARMEARAGLMAGDERYLPPRDQGPAKAFVRDFVDGRRRASEYFVFVAIAILLATFLRDPTVVGIASIVWFLVVVVIILEMTWTVLTLNKELKQRWPEKADRKGCQLYCILRALQIRRLRVPPPRVGPGGKPVKPKS